METNNKAYEKQTDMYKRLSDLEEETQGQRYLKNLPLTITISKTQKQFINKADEEILREKFNKMWENGTDKIEGEFPQEETNGVFIQSQEDLTKDVWNILRSLE